MPQSKTRYVRVLAVIAAVSGAAAALAAPPARADQAAGAETIELRLQTASNVAGGSLFGLVAGPGFTYQTGSGNPWTLNLAGGAGFFVSPMVAVGTDVGLTVLSSRSTLTLFSVVPFVKVVTGLPERQTGVFFEPEVGLVIASANNTEALLQAGGWLGAHLWVNRSIAFLIGPSATYLRNLSSNGGDTGFIGARLGIATYLP